MAKRSKAIVDDYLRLIVSGGVAVGQLLPTETTLAVEYHVSRTAVREAVQALAAKGFVLVRQGSGTTVAPRSSWNVLDPDYLAVTGSGTAMLDDLLETRDMVEPAIAGLAAQRAKPAEIVELRQLVAEFADSLGGDPTVNAGFDMAFHHKLAECTGNPVLISIHASISHLSRAQRRAMVRIDGAVERTLFWHEHIVDAIAAGDVSAAQDAMRMHLRQVHADLSAAISERTCAQPQTASTSPG